MADETIVNSDDVFTNQELSSFADNGVWFDGFDDGLGFTDDELSARNAGQQADDTSQDVEDDGMIEDDVSTINVKELAKYECLVALGLQHTRLEAAIARSNTLTSDNNNINTNTSISTSNNINTASNASTTTTNINNTSNSTNITTTTNSNSNSNNTHNPDASVICRDHNNNNKNNNNNNNNNVVVTTHAQSLAAKIKSLQDILTLNIERYHRDNLDAVELSETLATAVAPLPMGMQFNNKHVHSRKWQATALKYFKWTLMQVGVAMVVQAKLIRTESAMGMVAIPTTPSTVALTISQRLQHCIKHHDNTTKELMHTVTQAVLATTERCHDAQTEATRDPVHKQALASVLDRRVLIDGANVRQRFFFHRPRTLTISLPTATHTALSSVSTTLPTALSTTSTSPPLPPSLSTSPSPPRQSPQQPSSSSLSSSSSLDIITSIEKLFRSAEVVAPFIQAKLTTLCHNVEQQQQQQQQQYLSDNNNNNNNHSSSNKNNNSNGNSSNNSNNITTNNINTNTTSTSTTNTNTTTNNNSNSDKNNNNNNTNNNNTTTTTTDHNNARLVLTQRHPIRRFAHIASQVYQHHHDVSYVTDVLCWVVACDTYSDLDGCLSALENDNQFEIVRRSFSVAGEVADVEVMAINGGCRDVQLWATLQGSDHVFQIKLALKSMLEINNNFGDTLHRLAAGLEVFDKLRRDVECARL